MGAGVLKLRREKKRERADELGELVAAIRAEFRDRVLLVDIDTARHIARLGREDAPPAHPPCKLDRCRHRGASWIDVAPDNMDEMGGLGIGARDPFAKLPPDA